MRYWLEIMKNLQPQWAFNKKILTAECLNAKVLKARPLLD